MIRRCMNSYDFRYHFKFLKPEDYNLKAMAYTLVISLALSVAFIPVPLLMAVSLLTAFITFIAFLSYACACSNRRVDKFLENPQAEMERRQKKAKPFAIAFGSITLLAYAIIGIAILLLL